MLVAVMNPVPLDTLVISHQISVYLVTEHVSNALGPIQLHAKNALQQIFSMDKHALLDALLDSIYRTINAYPVQMSATNVHNRGNAHSAPEGISLT